MGSEAPVLARVTETTAGNVEPPHLCNDTCRDEDEGQCGQNQQSPAVKEPQDKSKAAEQFEPRQIKGESNAYRPGQHFVIVDIDGESKRINSLNHARVNENSTDDKSDNAPKDIARGQVHLTREANAQRPTSNAQRAMVESGCCVGRWALSVER